MWDNKIYNFIFDNASISCCCHCVFVIQVLTQLKTPEEHLIESSAGNTGECNKTESNAVNEVDSSAAETNAESSAAEANATQTSKPKKKKSGKNPCLCDVVEQSNQQMKQMQEYITAVSLGNLKQIMSHAQC